MQNIVHLASIPANVNPIIFRLAKGGPIRKQLI